VGTVLAVQARWLGTCSPLLATDALRITVQL